VFDEGGSSACIEHPIEARQEHEMKTLNAWTAIRAALIAAVVAVASPAFAGDLPLKDARLKIEYNATDRDVGVQLFVDAEPWKSVDVYDTTGRLLFRSTARGAFGKQGGSELFIESGEPSLDEVPLDVFLKRFPEGNYMVVANGIEGERYVGYAKFTNIPAGPQLVSPQEDDVVDADELTVKWKPVAAPNGSPIIGYQVLVVRPDTGITALPKIVLDVMMPPTATRMEVPDGFLQRHSTYEWEVLAIESGGNQTLSSRKFRTR
jgi:hypothetical protein